MAGEARQTTEKGVANNALGGRTRTRTVLNQLPKVMPVIGGAPP
jgi:hypothetical protein